MVWSRCVDKDIIEIIYFSDPDQCANDNSKINYFSNSSFMSDEAEQIKKLVFLIESLV
jgi:hypothetical protein